MKKGLRELVLFGRLVSDDMVFLVVTVLIIINVKLDWVIMEVVSVVNQREPIGFLCHFWRNCRSVKTLILFLLSSLFLVCICMFMFLFYLTLYLPDFLEGLMWMFGSYIVLLGSSCKLLSWINIYSVCPTNLRNYNNILVHWVKIIGTNTNGKVIIMKMQDIEKIFFRLYM